MGGEHRQPAKMRLRFLRRYRFHRNLQSPANGLSNVTRGYAFFTHGVILFVSRVVQTGLPEFGTLLAHIWPKSARLGALGDLLNLFGIIVLEWSHPPGSNRRPADYESAALPTELGWLDLWFDQVNENGDRNLDSIGFNLSFRPDRPQDSILADDQGIRPRPSRSQEPT